MNNMTITDANRKFTHLIRQVDSEGLVGISKGGEVKYILMTRKEFENMNTTLTFGKAGDQIICVETSETAKIWKFDKNLESYTMYEAEKVNIDGNHITMDAKEFFRVSFWEDLMEEPDKRAKELYDMAPENLPEYTLSVKSKDKVWE